MELQRIRNSGSNAASMKSVALRHVKCAKPFSCKLRSLSERGLAEMVDQVDLGDQTVKFSIICDNRHLIFFE